jgi:hypothetical protein
MAAEHGQMPATCPSEASPLASGAAASPILPRTRTAAAGAPLANGSASCRRWAIPNGPASWTRARSSRSAPLAAGQQAWARPARTCWGRMASWTGTRPCPDVPQRVNPQIAEQMEMERLQDLLGRVGRGAAARANGMFSMARRYNCAGHSEKPRWTGAGLGNLDRAAQSVTLRNMLRRAL